MIILDWGDCDERIIILKIQDTLHINNLKHVIQNLKKMIAQKSNMIDMIIDIRSAHHIQANIFREVHHQISQRSPKLNNIVMITTTQQALTIQLVTSFYPSISSEIIIVESVEQAYGLILDVA